MKESRFRTFTIFVLSFVISSVLAATISCGGNNTPTTATNGTVNVSMTDPGVCSFEFSHIYVTVTKVMANINADAGPGGNGWRTLVDLTKSPMQIDLLSLNPKNICLLQQLGSGTTLPAGKYQQIRLYLLSNTASGSGTPSSNACLNNSGWNCAVTGTDPNALYTELQLPSEVQTGIKIPSPNIMGGGFTVTAGETVDLNLNFQSCESVVQTGNGGYLLKPVLFAGEVSPNMDTITGQVVVGDSSGQPVLTNNQTTPVPNAIVLFEQPTNNVETVVSSATADQNGNFLGCTIPGANDDIVVAAQTGVLGTSATTYNPTVAFNVPLRTKLGEVPLVPETSSTVLTGGAATLIGEVDTSSTSKPESESVTLTPTMSLTPAGGSATDVVIPVFSLNSQPATADPPSVMTVASASCTVNGADCSLFSLTVPASNATIGTYSGGSITFQGPAAGSILYKLTAASGNCTGGPVSHGPVSVTANGTTTLSNFLLTSCN